MGIFPDRNALIRLLGAVPAEQHHEWAESRRYLGPDDLSKSRTEQTRRNHHLEYHTTTTYTTSLDLTPAQGPARRSAANRLLCGVLHLRVIAPQGRSEDVIALLQAEVGVAHLVVHRGAALEPEGDEITADIARECANELVQSLKELGIEHCGAITLDVVDTVLSTAAHRAEEEAEGDPANAIVWDELAARTRDESRLNVTFLAFLCLACLIAAVGVVTNSPVTVVGAMVVGPEFGPLAALAVAIVRRRANLARRAALALVIGFPVAMAVTTAGTLAAEALGWVTLKDTSELRDVDFIFQIGPLSFVVALLAGAAGMLSLVSAKSAALVGVFISVTTVPAAGFAVIAATIGDWDVALESTAQLTLNLAGIVLAGVLVLWLHRRHGGPQSAL